MSEATTDNLRKWLDAAKIADATHMLVVLNTGDWTEYPVLVEAGEDAAKTVKWYAGRRGTRVLEVYSLSGDLERQLAEPRAWHV